MTGAAPVPVPPPIPAVIKTISASFSAVRSSSRDSSAARRPTSGLLVRQELAPTAPAKSAAAEPGDAPPAALTSARLYTTAQGVLDVSIDGAPVGDAVLAPGWTSYHDYTEFDVHDVTAALASPGPHVLGLRLADGWFAGCIGALGESAQYGSSRVGRAHPRR